jgi:hypothetical protein
MKKMRDSIRSSRRPMGGKAATMAATGCEGGLEGANWT